MTPSAREADEARDASQARVGESVERMRLDRLRREEAEARASEEAARTAAADEAKHYAARVKAAAEARRLEAEHKERDAAVARADGNAGRRYDAMPAPTAPAAATPPADARAADARPREEAEARAADARAREESDRAAARLIAMPAIPAPSPGSTAAAAVAAAPDVASPPRARTNASTDARDLVKRLVAEAGVPAVADGGVPAVEARVPAVEARVPAVEARVPAVATGSEASVRSRVAPPITVAETPVATVSVADTVTVVAAADTAHLVASPTVTIQAARPVDAAPIATEPEQSDGVVRAMIATIDTAKLARQRQQRQEPEHDGPTIKETTGEIASPQPRDAAPGEAVSGQASIVIDQPSMLVSDLAAVHAAAARAVAAPPPVPPPHDAASASRELAVSEVRKDAAVAFTDVEEAFFTKVESASVRTPKLETFDDLDEGYEPPKFWDRVFGRKKPPPR